MVYFFLPKSKEYIKKTLILDFLIKKIKPTYKYEICWVNKHIVNLPEFTSTDIAVWHPTIASYNIETVASVTSIVILERETLFLQKLSKFNPINENLAVSHGFYVYYMDDETDITNDEWKIVIKQEEYLITFKEIVNILNQETYENSDLR